MALTEPTPRPVGLRLTALLDSSTTIPPLLQTAPRRPTLSWTVPLVRRGQRQTRYEVQIRRDGEPRTETFGARVGEMFAIVPHDLAPHSAYWWSVRTWDESDVVSEWADEVVFETGPLTREDWNAEWLAAAPGRVVRLVIPPITAVGAIRARLDLAAQGLVVARIDGHDLGDNLVTPSRTDRSRALARTLDVSANLHRDRPTHLDLFVASGSWASTGLTPRVLAEVRLLSPGRRVTLAATGRASLVSDVAFVTETHLYLERHEGDARDARFSRVPAEAGESSGALAEPCASVSPDTTPPVATASQHDAIEILRMENGTRVFDAGTNISGRAELLGAPPLPPGTSLVMVHGEMLDGRGRVHTGNIAMPFDPPGTERQVFEYVVGDCDRRIRPMFAIYGFRYVEVRGIPVDVDVDLSVSAVHSAIRSTSRLSIDHPRLALLNAAGIRTQLNSFLGVPVDCPTREQNAWTGDAGATVDLAFAQFDMRDFFAKWLGDFATSQNSVGEIPAIVPGHEPDAVPPDPVWAAALHRVLLGVWLHYGDRTVVEQYLPILRRWAEALWTYRDGLNLISGAPISYGHDWLALEQTEPELLHTAATIEAFHALSLLLSAVEPISDSALWDQRAKALIRGLRSAYVIERARSGRVSSQGHIVALVSADVGARFEKNSAVQALRSRFDRAGGVTTGYATTNLLVTRLSEARADDLVLRTIEADDQPSVGAMLVSGPGTFWESWRMDADNRGTGSLDHIGLGGPFANWVWRSVVGIAPVERGYRIFEVRPAVVPGVDRWEASIETVYGVIHAAYRRLGDAVRLRLMVPVGATARIRAGHGRDERGSGEHVVEWTETAPRRDDAARSGPRLPSEGTVAAREGAITNVLVWDVGMAGKGALDVLPAGLACAPVAHEQYGGTVYRCPASAGTPTGGPVIGIEIVIPDAGESESRELVIDIDICQMTSPTPLFACVAVSIGKAERTVRQRLWPAGWTSVRVPVVRAEAGAASVRISVAADDGSDAPTGPWSVGAIRLV